MLANYMRMFWQEVTQVVAIFGVPIFAVLSVVAYTFLILTVYRLVLHKRWRRDLDAAMPEISRRTITELRREVKSLKAQLAMKTELSVMLGQAKKAALIEMHNACEILQMVSAEIEAENLQMEAIK